MSNTIKKKELCKSQNKYDFIDFKNQLNFEISGWIICSNYLFFHPWVLSNILIFTGIEQYILKSDDGDDTIFNYYYYY